MTLFRYKVPVEIFVIRFRKAITICVHLKATVASSNMAGNVVPLQSFSTKFPAPSSECENYSRNFKKLMHGPRAEPVNLCDHRPRAIAMNGEGAGRKKEKIEEDI
ncbi:hypothetical protein EVAR_84884_1 [Eumeta japonica]|uniref:Uncharacterized protein n=1 Tax=Eumeta variegata TaxID=151549 RepID=A0A4C1YHK7_EUMVA|nr:hypothetical protein EVAR_84884_1 [Eumeta japonica]